MHATKDQQALERVLAITALADALLSPERKHHIRVDLAMDRSLEAV